MCRFFIYFDVFANVSTSYYSFNKKNFLLFNIPLFTVGQTFQVDGKKKTFNTEYHVIITVC